jgi:hypothetical protein
VGEKLMKNGDFAGLWKMVVEDPTTNVGHQFTGHPTLPATRVDAFLVPPL